MIKINIVLYTQDGWIITDIVNNLVSGLKNKNCEVVLSNSPLKNYEVYYHFIYSNIKIEKLNLNALNICYVTHIDSVKKYKKIHYLDNYIDAFICMSSDTSLKLQFFGINRTKLKVILPYIKRTNKKLKIGIFSNNYTDKRKNENEIISSLLKLNNEFIEVYIVGYGWDNLIQQLNQNNFQVINIEFNPEIYSLTMSLVDYIIYAGFDEGSMATLDAVYYGKKMIITDQGFHKILKDVFFIRKKRNITNRIFQILNKAQNDTSIINSLTIENFVDKHFLLFEDLVSNRISSKWYKVNYINKVWRKINLISKINLLCLEKMNMLQKFH
jgi:hypothetical protein